MIYNPVYEFERMRSLLDDLLSNSGTGEYKNEEAELTNIFENNSGYMLQFLAPGVKLEDISVNYSNGILSISLKRIPDMKADKDKRILRNERSVINFTRSYRISDDADLDKIEAKLLNGMLMVHIPKKEQAKPKKISIKVQ